MKQVRSLLKTQRRGPREIEHADIVRMAAIVAANRAVERRDRIATAAYFRAERRGFEPGHELEDWLDAECEVAHCQASEES